MTRSIDWRTVLLLPPKRRFSAAELQRAVPARANLTLRLTVALNTLLCLGVLFFGIGRRGLALYALLIALPTLAFVAAGSMAWRDPGSRGARVAYWSVPLLALALALAARDRMPQEALLPFVIQMMLGSFGLWAIIVYRTQYIEMRLREQDERERSIEMARRLAAAQIEPHFLFNTLASVQHWVHTGDARAAPLLDALTGYLRATLPMFDRALHPLGQELVAVRGYLEVMRSRLGPRLRLAIDIPDELHALLLPPGLLLTLVENAVVHGIEPQIDGGEITLGARVADAQACIDVRDSGPGPQPGAGDGVGLANSRARLGLTLGLAARLTLGRGEQGGGHASVQVPWPGPALPEGPR